LCCILCANKVEYIYRTLHETENPRYETSEGQTVQGLQRLQGLLFIPSSYEIVNLVHVGFLAGQRVVSPNLVLLGRSGQMVADTARGRLCHDCAQVVHTQTHTRDMLLR